MPSLRACLFVSLLGSACTVAAPRHLTLAAPAPQEAQPPAEAGSDKWGERLLLEAAVIPGAWLTRDLDGGLSNPDAEDAAGFAARVATGNAEQSFGVLYQRFEADGGALDLDTLSLDFDVRTSLAEEGPSLFFLRAGASVGGAWLDLPVRDPGTELNAQLRIGVDFQPTRWLQVGASFGGIIVGHPGDTQAYGTFLTAGLALVF